MMANLNDFKIVTQRSLSYSKLLNLSEKLDNFTRQQMGFYLLVLECVTNEKDPDELVEMIIDDKFCKDYWGKGNDDLGVDAVYIDKDNKLIQLFNFKYRKNFKEEDSTKESDVYDASRFLSAVLEEDTRGLSARTKEKVESVVECLASTDIYSIELLMVANVNNGFSISPAINIFKKSLGLKVENITLDKIVPFVSDSPKAKKAELMVDSEAALTYERNGYSTAKSFLIKISLAELVRITCTDEELRVTQITDYAKLDGVELEMSLLYENVRGYLGETRYNKNITDTIVDNPSYFFMFNNGITIVAKSVETDYVNAKKKLKITIDEFQIVNGGQTLRSVYRFCENNFDQEKLAEAEVLVRIYKADKDFLVNDIAEYTNSQNAIAPSDLKSVSSLQRQIETYLGEKDILYIRKTGDVGNKKICDLNISMERTAQIIYSANGYPERAANNKKKLFGEYYKEIFPDNLELEKTEQLIRQYFLIKELYGKTKYAKYDQKYLYIIYMISKIDNNSSEKLNDKVNKMIELLERTLENFDTESNVAQSRKILRTAFKQEIDKALSKREV